MSLKYEPVSVPQHISLNAGRLTGKIARKARKERNTKIKKERGLAKVSTRPPVPPLIFVYYSLLGDIRLWDRLGRSQIRASSLLLTSPALRPTNPESITSTYNLPPLILKSSHIPAKTSKRV